MCVCVCVCESKVTTEPFLLCSIAKHLGALTVCSRALEYHKSRPLLSEVVTDAESVDAIVRFAGESWRQKFGAKICTGAVSQRCTSFFFFSFMVFLIEIAFDLLQLDCVMTTLRLSMCANSLQRPGTQRVTHSTLTA